MNKTLTSIVAAVMLLACSPVALGQSAFYGQQRQYAGGQFAGASIYQPTMTAMTVTMTMTNDDDDDDDDDEDDDDGDGGVHGFG